MIVMLAGDLLAQGLVLARDNFDYDPGEIGGLSGGTGEWAEAWNTFSQPGASEIVTPETPLVFDTGADVLGGGNALRLTKTGTEQTALIRRFVSTASNETVYVRFLLRLESDTWDDNDFFVGFLDPNFANAGDARGTVPNVGLRAALSGANDIMARPQSNAGGEAVAPVAFSAQTTYLLVMKVQRVSGSGSTYNRATLWVNPTFQDEPNPAAVGAAYASSAFSVQYVGFRFGNTLDADDVILIDDLAVSTSWEGVIAPPKLVLARDNFDYEPGEIAGQNGGSGEWMAAWNTFSQPDASEIVTPGTPLVFTTGGITLGGGNALRLSPTANEVTPVIRRFVSTASNETVYVRFLLRLESDTWDSNDFFIGFLDPNQGNNTGSDIDYRGLVPNVGLRAGLPGANDIMARPHRDGGEAVAPVAFATYTTYLLVMKLESVDADSYNRVTLWVNPSARDENNPAAVGNDFSSGIFRTQYVGFRFGTTLDNDDVLLVDDLAVALSWDCIVPSLPSKGTLIRLF
jgi:hypothetical protein